MSREIKFRVWDNFSKSFLENYYPHQDDSLNEIFEHSSLVDSLVIEQFTDLKDKNNKDIYEGDIVLEEWKENYPYGYSPDRVCAMDRKYVIEYKAPSFIFKFKEKREQICIEDWSIEVIGNIHENPELLK